MKLYTGEVITNNFNREDKAVEAMNAPKTSDKVQPIHEATKQHFAQKDDAVEAMKTPITASMMNRN